MLFVHGFNSLRTISDVQANQPWVCAACECGGRTVHLSFGGAAVGNRAPPRERTRGSRTGPSRSPATRVQSRYLTCTSTTPFSFLLGCRMSICTRPCKLCSRHGQRQCVSNGLQSGTPFYLHAIVTREEVGREWVCLDGRAFG